MDFETTNTGSKDTRRGPIGPYDTKAEANEGKAGLIRFYTKEIHRKPTSEPQPEPA